MSEITTGRTVVEVRAAGDLAELMAAAGEFPGATSVRAVAGGEGDEGGPGGAGGAGSEGLVLVELETDDPAALNRFLAERGIYAAHLARRRLTLEEAFMELTGGDGFGEVS